MSKPIRLSVFFLLLISVAMLTSCSSQVWDKSPPPKPSIVGLAVGAATGAAVGSVVGGAGAPLGTLIGGAWGGAFGKIIEYHQTLVDKLMYNGVQVVQLGDEVKIIVPTDRFFYQHSAHLNPNYFPALDKVAKLIRQFPKVDVKVAGYTDNVGPWQRNLALSRLQARLLIRYLWSAGIDTRLLYGSGYGSADPIASNNTARGRYLNRRVEITLRKISPKILV